MSPSGSFVWELGRPRGADGRAKGFAFASFTSHGDAERAVAAANGRELRGRPVAADWAVGKAEYQRLQQEQQQQAGGGAAAGSAAAAAAASSGDEEDEESEEVREEEEEE